MLNKEEGRRRVRVAVTAEMGRLGWNIQDLINASGLDRKTVSSFLEGERWPQMSKRSRIEAALGWQPGTMAGILEGAVGGGTQDADYVAAPGERTDQAVTNEQVLAELRAMREDVNALSRRVARIESDPEPVGGADGSP
jgi:hypothetical protein